jgi:hypothetical protein
MSSIEETELTVADQRSGILENWPKHICLCASSAPFLSFQSSGVALGCTKQNNDNDLIPECLHVACLSQQSLMRLMRNAKGTCTG